MNINLVVHGGVYSSQSAYSAYSFAQQAVLSGHVLTQVFFYQDGVSQANELAVPLGDEFNPVEAWSDLSKRYQVPLLVCISAAERRGVLGEAQCVEAGKNAANLSADFDVQGLGVMHDACLRADRTVTFK